MDDINKAGEGSRGGTVIGHSPSGKAIYRNSSHESHSAFKPDDHKAAANLHQDIYDRAQKKLQAKHAEDSNFKPDQKVYDFLQHHQKQAAVHTSGGQKPGAPAGDGKKKPEPKKEEKPPTKKEFKAQTDKQTMVATINKLRSEGRTGEARRLYDKHVNPAGRGAYVKKAHNLLEALGKGGPGSGKKGHQTEGLSEQDLHNRREKFAHEKYAKFRHHSGEGLNDADKFKHGMVQDAKNSGYIKKSEDLEKAKYTKRTGTPGNYKYEYGAPKSKSNSHHEILKEAFGKQITFSGPGGKEYSAFVYGEPDNEGKIILKFDPQGFRRVDIASVENPVVSEPGRILSPKPIVKGKSLGWPPSGFVEPERKGNKTTEKLWYKLGTENQEGRPDTTGKLSSKDNQYMSPKGSTCNLVGNVAFGKASHLAQRQLNQKLQMTEVLLTDMGIKMKTPMDFICQDMEDGQRGVMAQFLPMNQHRNDKINLAKNLKTVNKSLLHEIGHGIDYAMEQKGLAGSFFRGSPGHFREDINQLTDVLRNSKFYEATGAKDAPGNKDDDFLVPDERYANYLKDESEVFARAFEVYTLNHAQEMVSEGKLPAEYIENFVPDYLKAGFTQRTIDPDAYDETMDKVTEIMDRIFSNRAIQKAMKEVDLLETLRKNVVPTDDQGSATETGMYSNDLYSNASNPLMGIIKDALEDHMFGTDPVKVMISPGTILTAVKVDDGVYSGHVTRENAGEVENVLKIEKQTLPTLLQFLKVKELIPTVVEEPIKEESSGDYKMKVIDLLDKLL